MSIDTRTSITVPHTPFFQASNSVNPLPNELEAYIFSFLDPSTDRVPVARTCRAGRLATGKDSVYWHYLAQRLDLPHDSRLSPREFVQKTVSRVKIYQERGYYHPRPHKDPISRIMRRRKSSAFQLAEFLANDPIGTQLPLICPWIPPQLAPEVYRPLPGLNSKGVCRLVHEAFEDQDFTKLNIALHQGASLPQRQRLLDEPDRQGVFPIPRAAREGKVMWLKGLIRASGPSGAARYHGADALHRAIRHRHLECVQLLIQSGIDLDSPTRSDNWPLGLAARKGSLKILQALIEGGADLNVQSPVFGTAAHQAASRGHLRCLQALIRAGANIRLRDPQGRSPLDKTVVRKQRACFSLILETLLSQLTKDNSCCQEKHRLAADLLSDIAKAASRVKNTRHTMGRQLKKAQKQVIAALASP